MKEKFKAVSPSGLKICPEEYLPIVEGAIGRNINQIAKRGAAGGFVSMVISRRFREGWTRFGYYKDASYQINFDNCIYPYLWSNSEAFAESPLDKFCIEKRYFPMYICDTLCYN